MEAAIVKFEKFSREPDMDLSIIQAIHMIRESTQHDVTFDLNKYDTMERRGFGRGKAFRITELKVMIKIPVTEEQK